jgi:hypothetical protein
MDGNEVMWRRVEEGKVGGYGKKERSHGATG